MNSKTNIDDYVGTTDKKSRNHSKQQIKRKQIDSLTKVSESMFTHYKQSTNIQKRKRNFDYKSICESLITRPTQLKTSINIEDIIPLRNKSKQNTQCPKLIINNPLSKKHSKQLNENQSITTSSVLNTSNNFVSHTKNKSTLTIVKKKSVSKDKQQTIGVTGGSNKNKLELCDYIKTQLNLNSKSNQKIRQQKIKELMLSHHHHYTSTTYDNNNTNNDKSNEASTRMIPIKKRKKKKKPISRTNSNSNLEQTTKTSTEATTTTSKRLHDEILKLSSNKPIIQNNFNTKLNKNFSSLYSNHIVKNNNNKGKRNCHLNNTLYNHYQAINKTMNNSNGIQSVIMNTEEIIHQCNDYNHLPTNVNVNSSIAKTIHLKGYNDASKGKCISETLFNDILKQNTEGKKIKLNDTASLSLLSEDSVFNHSKHRSTSGNNNKNDTNTLANQNDSISFKQNSQKHSSNNNSNTIERRSLSKDKLSNENEAEPTVSYTYSDDEFSNRKSHKSKRNLQRPFLNDDFLTFYSEMNHKLFGYHHLNTNTNQSTHHN